MPIVSHAEEGWNLAKKLGARLEESQEARARLLRLNHAWDLKSIVKRLAEAADHLLSEHSCDAHGYEGLDIARRAALEWLKFEADDRLPTTAAQAKKAQLGGDWNV